MDINKETLWPKEGKLKKGIIILIVVILSAFVITLLGEKTNFKHGKRLPVIIALACTAIWFYQPAKKENA